MTFRLLLDLRERVNGELERAEKIAMRQAGMMPVPDATPGAIVTPDTQAMHAAHAAVIAREQAAAESVRRN